MAQMQIRQAPKEQRILQLEAETLRLTMEAAHSPLQPIISREDVDGLAAHVLGKIQAQVAEEEGACVRWCRETYDEPWKTNAQQQTYQILGDRKVPFENTIRRFEEENQWLEDGVGPWNKPAFTVPKPKDDRVVNDYRYVNGCTEIDVPRIEDILLNQGKFKLWSVLDMKDGYYQVL